jgi:ABC-type nitrate/sulfonate/bicarbonate transport system substrate-binding protein
MTAPDCSSLVVPGDRAGDRTTVRVGLQWPPKPDYLPLIAVRDWGLAASRGIPVELGERRGYSDGLAALERGDCDLILINPLHLLEAQAHGCEALGCLSHTRGGVLAREDRLGKLRAGEIIHVASTISGPLTDRLCRRILQGWAGAQGFAVAETQIVVEPAEFNHVDNLRAGFDAAWLAFANTDEVAARQRGIAVRLLTEEQAGLPGFSALELVARKARRPDETARHEMLITLLETAVRRLKSDPQAAVRLWRQASGHHGDEVAQVLASLPCLLAPLNRTPGRWNVLAGLLQEA